MRGVRRWARAGAVVLAVVLAATAAAFGAIARAAVPAHPGTGLDRCAAALFGPESGHPARPVAGSAGPTVVSSFAVFRRHRTAADRLSVGGLGRTLADAGALTYDPSAAVRLLRSGAHGTLYAVPATLAAESLPAACAGRAGARAYLAQRMDDLGSGPGACLIATQLVPPPPSLLPGRTRPGPRLVVSAAQCESEVVLSGYVGALGEGDLGTAQVHALIPDGLSSITYTFSDGHAVTAPATGNLVTLPAPLSKHRVLRHTTASGLARLLAARLPTTITETGSAGQPTVTLTRPASLIADSVGAYRFLRRLALVSRSRTSGTSTSSSGASCSARTHRCVAVTVTMRCPSARHCHLSRTIHRYRYRTARPPRGTTHAGRQPTGPILARVVRVLTRPTKIALQLRGAPRHRVEVLVSVMCSTRHGGAGISGPPLVVRVPSRTPIPLPGRARSFRSCDVGALVIARGRGAVRATIVRN